MTRPAQPEVRPAGRWVDLAQRVGSAMVILVLGTGLLLAPRPWSDLGLAALFGALMWELARLVVPPTAPEGVQLPVPRPGPAASGRAAGSRTGPCASPASSPPWWVRWCSARSC